MSDQIETDVIDVTDAQAGGDSTPLRGRRQVLLGGGAAALALVAAACGGDDDDGGGDEAAGAATASGTPATPDTSGDLVVARRAAGLEVLAAATYGAALEAATSGALGAVPPAVETFMTTAVEHHQAHLRAWNDVLFAGDEEEVTEAPADLQESVDDELADVTDVEGAARLALRLEETAAATYLDAIPQLVDSAAISLAATIQPIDMQHAAVLRFVLGEYPVPETFASTDQAYTA
jgi:hypothetical protein